MFMPPKNIQSPSRLNIIESSYKTSKKYCVRVRGERNETRQLNIHVKTLMKKFLSKCMIAKQLNQSDIKVFKQYKGMSANFESINFLYRKLSDFARLMCKQYIESSEVIADILKSDRMFIGNKIIILKYMKKISSNIEKPIECWKQQYFKNRNKSKISVSKNDHENNISFGNSKANRKQTEQAIVSINISTKSDALEIGKQNLTLSWQQF